MIERVNIYLLEQFLNKQIHDYEVLNENGSTLTPKELKQAVKEYCDLTIGIEAAGLKERLKDIHNEVVSSRVKTIWFRVLTTAAVLTLITVASVFLLKKSNNNEFNDYFTHFDQLLTFRGDNEDEYLYSAIEAYDKRDYSKAFQEFKQLSMNTLNPEINFYIGVSALGSNQFEEAINYFERASSDSKYDEQTLWYSALAYWQLGNISASRELLVTIRQGEFKFEQAQKLLKYLKSS